MHTFQLYITDDRYSVPTLKLVLASNSNGAREEAERMLMESPHHVRVVGFLNALRLFDVARPAEDRDLAPAGGVANDPAIPI